MRLAKKKVSKKKVSKKKVTKKASPAKPRKKTSPSKKKATTKSKATTAKKKAASKKPTAKKTTAKKKVVKKSAPKKTTKKKSAAKKTSNKKVAKKAAKKKLTKKKVAKKTTASKAQAKKTAKKTAAKTTKKKTTASKVAKKTETKAQAPVSKSADAKAQPAAAASPSKPGGPGGRKKKSSKSKKPELIMPTRPLLLGPNGPSLKPLIPSGAQFKREDSVLENVTSRRTKTPLTKAQLEHYRQVLLSKRSELLGDMRNLEEEALRSDSGGTSHTSQHLAEQGSESYEQSLNLNLAASDRERITEIDAALQRIADRTYGLCELTFQPIKKARLDEIPWARYTIEAAREMDRKGWKR